MHIRASVNVVIICRGGLLDKAPGIQILRVKCTEFVQFYLPGREQLFQQAYVDCCPLRILISSLNYLVPLRVEMLLPHDRDSLVSVSSLPHSFQPLFKYRYFNAVQSESFLEAYASDDNMVISAPTGSGKTGIFELCILRLLSKSVTPEGHFNPLPASQKIVYIAPMKALVQEISREWKEKFGSVLGLVCQELTGDSDILKPSQMQETDIILTTPEKFDSITRNHRDHGGAGFFGDIALVLIDEVHLLNDSRGASLEAVVSRIKMLSRHPELKASPIARVRFVAVSATMPNIEDLAEWLSAPQRGMKRFGEEMRPVKLATKVYGNIAMMDNVDTRLQNYLYDVIVQHSRGKPTLVFCCTRKGAQEAALMLSDTVSKPGVHNPFIKSQEQFNRLQVSATGAIDKSIHTCILRGVAYHNGGLGAVDRALVEGLFLKGDLQVLCTTSTLAQGVNLPAHLVVIKSTQFYNKKKGRYVEQDRSTLLQMCGRAGRPQFDDSGVVVVMTRNETVHLYENILSGSEPVESELLPSIAEHLNAEIVLMTVSDVGLAIDWLKCSYLYVRMRKHPGHYKIQKGITEEQMVKHMKGICLLTVNELAKHGMVLMDEYGFTLKPLEPGKLMAKYYLNFETMKTITGIPDQSTMPELLFALAKAQELSWIQLRRYEKKFLNTINQDYSGRIRFHVLGSNGKLKKRIQTSDEKVFLLVNDMLCDEPSTLDFTMSQDVNGICANGARIARCMGDYFKFVKRYKETQNSMLLAKCLRQRLWDDSAHQLKQLPGIGAVTVKTFQTAGIDSFEKLASADPRQLELITGRRFPYGDQVKESLHLLPPKVDLTIRETGFRVGGKNEFTLELTRTTQPRIGSKWHVADLIVGDDSENLILFHERIRLDQFGSPYVIGVYSTNGISAALICEEFVGIDLLNKTAESNVAEAATTSSGRKTSQQRERKKQSRKIVLPIVAVSQQNKASVNQAVERTVELPPLLVNPKFPQDHYFASQSPPRQLSRSELATLASNVNEDGSGMVDSPILTNIAANCQERYPRNDGKTGTNVASRDSHDYHEEFDHTVWSHEQDSLQKTKTEHTPFDNGAIPRPELSYFTAHPSFLENGSHTTRIANEDGRLDAIVQISGSTPLQNKRHYWSTSEVLDGNHGNVHHASQSSQGEESKRRQVHQSVADRPLNDTIKVAEVVQFMKGSMRSGKGIGYSESENETSTQLPTYAAHTSAIESARCIPAHNSTGVPTFKFESGRRQAKEGRSCWLLGADFEETNGQTTPVLPSCDSSAAVEEEHLHSPKKSFEGKSLFSFLFE